MNILCYEKEKCIGSGACEATNPDHFKIDKDGKAILLNGREVSKGLFEKEISESDEMAKIAVMGCPPKCIKILDQNRKEIEV